MTERRHPTEEAFLAGDSLRAVAALAVFTFHAAFGAAGADGFHPRVFGDTGAELNDAFGRADALFEVMPLGVYVFFSLSGYLLSRRFVRAFVERERHPSLRTFLRNRVLRIVPAFWFVTALSFLIFGVGDSSLVEILAIPLFAQVFVQGPVTGTIAHAWTIDTEWALYLGIPLAVVALTPLVPARAGRGARLAIVLAALAAVYCASMAFRAFGDTGTWEQRAFWSASWSFVPGILLAVIEVNWAERLRGAAWGRAAAWALMGLWLLSMAAYVTIDVEASGQRAVAATAATFFVIAGPLLLQWTTGDCWRMLASRPLRWLGERSYGFYLIHFVVGVKVAEQLTEANGARADLVITLPLTLALTILAAHLIYRFVESPFLVRKRHQTPSAGAPQPEGVAGDHVVSAR